MEQKIITSSSASGLNQKIADMQKDGWEPIGSHHVVTTHEQKRFSGAQHKDTIFEHEYSQTMRKNAEDIQQEFNKLGKSKEDLIEYYERNIEKVKAHWGTHGERGQEYIDYAEKELEAVKNGRGW